MVDLDAIYSKNVGGKKQESGRNEASSIDLDSIFQKNVGQKSSKLENKSVSTSSSSNASAMKPQELISLLSSLAKEVSNPMAIATGTNYINAASQASSYIGNVASRAIAPSIGIDKLSSEPLGIAKTLGSALPESVPFANLGASNPSEILGKIPLKKPISEISPQGIARTVLASLVDPSNLAAVGIGGFRMNPNKLMTKAGKLEAKAERMATNLIQPNSKDLAKSINTGFTLPAVRETIDIMKTSKSLKELHGHIKTTVTKAANERNNILQKFNKPIDQSHILTAMGKFANEESAKGIRKKSFLRLLDQTLANEVDYLKSNPTIDIMSAQARKELLQDATDPLLNKRAMGTLNSERETADLLALDVIRKSYKEAILKALPPEEALAVGKLNSQMEGLIEAKNSVASRVAYSQLEDDPTIAGRAFSGIGLSPKIGILKAGAREFMEQTAMPYSTSKIARLRDEAMFLRHLAKTSDNLSYGKKIPMTMIGLKVGLRDRVEDKKR